MPTHLVNEPVLVAEAQAGNGHAFATLVNQYARNVYRLALSITGNQADAEDVLQESFLKAYAHLEHFQGRSRFYTWLVRITMNEALLKLRHRRRDRWMPLDERKEGEDGEPLPQEVVEWGENPAEQYRRQELGEILHREIARLEPAYRVVVVLRDMEELSTQEAAALLGLSIPAVKSRLLRGRLKLREQLNKYFQRSVNAGRNPETLESISHRPVLS